MASKYPPWLLELARELRTQDGLGTNVPLYEVQEQVYWPAHEDFDPTGWIQIDEDGSDAGGYVEGQEPDAEEGARVVPVWCSWRTVDVFLTRKAAEQSLRARLYNLNNPRVWVASGHRNSQLRQLRDWILTLLDVEETSG